MSKVVLLGNEAIARGAYEGGCQVAVGYPGTPSTEILETLAAVSREIKSQWSPNEKVALEVAAGSAIAGARTIMTTKHVGLNVAADPLFTFSYTGVNGGLVIINADDPGAWSSQNEQDNRHFARAAKVPMLEPADPEEARLFVKKAFEISEKYDRPVIIRSTTRLAHSRGVVNLGERTEVPLKPLERNPKKFVMIPAHARPRHVFVEEQLNKIEEDANELSLNRIEWRNRKRGIITGGVPYHHVREACPDDSILKIGQMWPLPKKLIQEFAAGVEELYVVEELDPFIEDFVKAMGIKIIGKEILPICGELTPEIIDKALNNKEIKNSFPTFPEKLPSRPPALCKGCPHAFLFDAAKRLNLYVNGDIGCYTLGVLPPYNAMHSQGCMGASIGMNLGMEKARGAEFARNAIAVIGDSTFIHSGITPLIDIVYNKGTGTVVILDNRITAMTGHQENPATGRTLMGEPTHELDLEALCRAIGVKRVICFNPASTEEVEDVLRTETAVAEPSVIIIKRKCILIKKQV